MRIGPEPTTDNFHVIEYADEEGKIPGTATPLITQAGTQAGPPPPPSNYQKQLLLLGGFFASFGEFFQFL